MAYSGTVFPVFNNQFAIGTNGIESSTEEMAPISCLESFSVSIDGAVQEFNPMEEQGWTRRLLTGKSFTISLNGKRAVGDKGNDYVAGLAFETGNAATTKFEWTMVDGRKLTFNCIVNITAVGGESTDIDVLEFEVMSDGKPTVAPAPAAASVKAKV